MSNDLLKKLDQAIEDKKSRITEAEAKAKEKRDALTGSDSIAPDSDEFKSITDELSGFYRTVDSTRDELEGLKSQRVTIARTVGAPAPGDDHEKGKGTPSESPAWMPEAFMEAFQKAQVAGRLPSIGERITTGDEFKAAEAAGLFRTTGKIGNIGLGKAMERHELKSLISRAADSAGAFIGAAGPQLLPFEPQLQQPIDLLQLLTTIEVSTDSVKYVVETAVNHNVRIVADPTTAEPIGSGDPAVTPLAAGLKPESAYTYGVKTADIETLAHFLPIHKNQLADVPQLRGILDAQMRLGLLLFLQAEVIAGTGGADHLTGVLNTGGIVAQPKGSDSVIDALHKVITGIRLGFNEPSAIVMHPRDWEVIRLLKDANGTYLFGPPSQAGATTLWGKPVLPSVAVPLGKPVVGDWRFAELYLREGISLLASDSHADFFRRNLIALLAEMRAGLGIRRPGAFGTVTGLPTS